MHILMRTRCLNFRISLTNALRYYKKRALQGVPECKISPVNNWHKGLPSYFHHRNGDLLCSFQPRFPASWQNGKCEPPARGSHSQALSVYLIEKVLGFINFYDNARRSFVVIHAKFPDQLRSRLH